MRLARFALPFCAGMAGAVAAYGAEPWRTITQECDRQAESSFCVGKAGCPNWQWLAKCTAHNYYNITPQAESRLNWCIQTIDADRTRNNTPAMTGNPVAEAMACLTGHQ